MLLMKSRYDLAIPGYTLPTNVQIKKRINKIAVQVVKDTTGMSKLKYWQVRQCVLDRFHGEEKYADTWKFYFPAHESKYNELVEKEKRLIEKRMKTAANKAERERKRLLKEEEKKLKQQQNAKEELLPLNQLKPQTQKSQTQKSQTQKSQAPNSQTTKSVAPISQKSSQAKKPSQTQKPVQLSPTDQTEKRKNSENAIPAPKRVKLCETEPEELMTDKTATHVINATTTGILNSPNVDRTGNLLKFMKIQSKEERAKTIKNCPESLLPEVKPELKFISTSQRPISPNSGSNVPEEEKKFGLPTQAGINKLFNKGGNDKHDKNADGIVEKNKSYI
jgi:myosin heavy subunit